MADLTGCEVNANVVLACGEEIELVGNVITVESYVCACAFSSSNIDLELNGSLSYSLNDKSELGAAFALSDVACSLGLNEASLIVCTVIDEGLTFGSGDVVLDGVEVVKERLVYFGRSYGICVLGICVLGLCVLRICVLGLCVLGICVLGVCVLGICVLGICVPGSSLRGILRICFLRIVTRTTGERKDHCKSKNCNEDFGPILFHFGFSFEEFLFIKTRVC